MSLQLQYMWQTGISRTFRPEVRMTLRMRSQLSTTSWLWHPMVELTMEIFGKGLSMTRLSSFRTALKLGRVPSLRAAARLSRFAVKPG